MGLKHSPDINYKSAFGMQFVIDKRPEITHEDLEVFKQELTKAGFRFDYNISGVYPSTLYINVYYKKPVEFIDSNGMKFCIPYYKRGMKPYEAKDRIMTITVDKSYHREKSWGEESDWQIHYSITPHFYGAVWLFGTKRVIVGERPAGFPWLYDYAESAEFFREELASGLKILKEYLDNGKPMIKE